MWSTNNYDCLLRHFAVLSVEEYTAISVLDITAWAQEILRDREMIELYWWTKDYCRYDSLLWRFDVINLGEYKRMATTCGRYIVEQYEARERRGEQE